MSHPYVIATEVFAVALVNGAVSQIVKDDALVQDSLLAVQPSLELGVRAPGRGDLYMAVNNVRLFVQLVLVAVYGGSNELTGLAVEV